MISVIAIYGAPFAGVGSYCITTDRTLIRNETTFRRH